MYGYYTTTTTTTTTTTATTRPVTGQLADTPTRGLPTRGLDNSRSRRCRQKNEN